jgi:hypothetical protein
VPSLAFGGTAYGSTVSVGAITSGSTAVVSVCSLAPGAASTNQAAKVNAGLLGSIGAVTSSITPTKTDTASSTVTTTTTAGTSLLAGLITANTITTTATSSFTPDGGFTNAGSTVVAGLKIAGQTVTATPGVNSKISIPNIATVTLNIQSASAVGGDHSKSVQGLRIDLLSGNPLGLGTGRIIIGSSTASLHDPVMNRAAGTAYGTQIDLAGIVKSGATAPVGLPCGGSNGVTRTNSTASVNVPGVLSAGATATTARSTDAPTGTTAEFSATTAGVNLLNGVVKVDAITAKASATRSGSTLTSSSDGTQIAGLKINGTTVEVPAGENSTLQIAGVGTLTFRKVVKSTVGVDVFGLELKLSTDQLGLKAGTTIQVAAARPRVTAS